MELSQADFEHLLQLRTGLRRFLRWSARQAEGVGLTPAQHQLLLAIAGHPGPDPPTIGQIADYLVLRHHSTGELIARAVSAGLVRRRQDQDNGSVMRVSLTPVGTAKLEALAAAHVEELAHLAPMMRTLWRALEEAGTDIPHPAALPRGQESTI